MSKKKSPVNNKKEFKSDPFGNLKGLAGSKRVDVNPKIVAPKESSPEIYGTFADEMTLLGVERITASNDSEDVIVAPTMCLAADQGQTEDEIFLAAMDAFPVSFEDHLPKDQSNAVVAPPPRRIKQLKRGNIVPDATLDLHGCVRADVNEKLSNFIQNGQHNRWSTLLVITGKGLHSHDGEAILRDEAESFLLNAGKSSVAEWGRAPKQYGGSGALVLFLRKQ